MRGLDRGLRTDLRGSGRNRIGWQLVCLMMRKALGEIVVEEYKTPQSTNYSSDPPPSTPCPPAQAQPSCVEGGICDFRQGTPFEVSLSPATAADPGGRCNSNLATADSEPACQNPSGDLADPRTLVRGSGGSGRVSAGEGWKRG